MKTSFILSSVIGSVLLFLQNDASRAAEHPLHIICFGAHPDDCEIQAGGVGAMWAAKGHKVKLVSVTNGDIGHWREAGGPLHVNEIYNRLMEGGFSFTRHNPTISIAVSLNRNSRFRKVAPGTFDLVIKDAAKAS